MLSLKPRRYNNLIRFHVGMTRIHSFPATDIYTSLSDHFMEMNIKPTLCLPLFRKDQAQLFRS